MSTTRRRFLSMSALAGGCTLAACHNKQELRSPALVSEPGTTACAEPTADGDRATGAALSGAADEVTDRFAALQGYCDGVPQVAAGEYEERLERGRRHAHDAGYDGLLLEAGVSLRYFSGVRWGQSERPMLLWIPVQGAAVWLPPVFEQGTLGERLDGSAVVRGWEEHEGPYAVLASLLREGGRRRAKVAVDPAMRLFVLTGLQSEGRGTRYAAGAEVIGRCRILKTDLELARLRRANEATKVALRAAAGLLEEGMTQAEFRNIVRQAQESAGLRRIWSLVLFGSNAAFPHGTKQDRAIRPGELVLVDTGGDLAGYQSDITRTWAFGPATDEQRRAWDTVSRAQTAALEKLRPGVTCGAVDAAARAVMDGAGYGGDYQKFTHRLGHGIGMQGHEEPYLVRASKRRLEPGMTMSNEPGIYVPGSYGVRIEDIVAITEQGSEVFGPRPVSLDAPFGE